jgi:hypothetical protein
MMDWGNPMYTRLSIFFLGLAVLLGISACQKYQVSLNDKVIYTPPGVFKDYQITDQQLADCVEQTIYDLHASSVEQITQLNCSNAGIKSLAGLGKFYALTALNLADNQLTAIDEISKLGRLQILILNNNPIKDMAPLLQLLHLQDLQLEKITTMDCASVAQLQANFKPLGAKILLPEHCTK